MIQPLLGVNTTGDAGEGAGWSVAEVRRCVG